VQPRIFDTCNAGACYPARLQTRSPTFRAERSCPWWCCGLRNSLPAIAKHACFCLQDTWNNVLVQPLIIGIRHLWSDIAFLLKHARHLPRCTLANNVGAIAWIQRWYVLTHVRRASVSSIKHIMASMNLGVCRRIMAERCFGHRLLVLAWNAVIWQVRGKCIVRVQQSAVRHSRLARYGSAMCDWQVTAMEALRYCFP
jgi:hypothetical protein